MSDRYVVRSAIAIEEGSVRNGVVRSTRAPQGFQIHDTFEDKREPDFYMSRAEAQDKCDRRNGR